MGYVMAGEAELISELIDSLWSEIVREKGEEVFSIQKEIFMKQPVALKRALIREAISRLRPSQRDLGFDVVERALDYVSGSQLGRRQVLIGNLEMLNLEDEIVLRESDSPILFTEFPQLTSDRRRKLPVPGRARLANGWLLDVMVEDLNTMNRDELMKNNGGRVVAIDEQSAIKPLALRPRKPGDRIRPLGLRGSTKISDLLINQQIPHPARARWPLVVSGNHIVWVVGLRMSDTFRLTETTQRVIILRLICPQDGMV
jgi:tRNA(Ile)-lysidine synthase